MSGIVAVSTMSGWLKQLSARQSDWQEPGASADAASTLFLAPGGAERPGHFPFARGISDRGYVDRPWVMGMYSGYASPRETNARFKALLASGQTGLSVALDLPTQIGIDSDHPLAAGEVGKVGVPLNSVDDMLALLDGLPIGQIRQMRTTANAMSPMFLAFVIVALDEMGIDPGSFELFLQNDPLKEFTSRGTWIFPPRPSLKLAVDVTEYMARHLPHWRPMQFCGYHIRDAGGTAVHEVAVAIANGLAYLDEALSRGLDAADLAPSMYFFLAAGLDIFEEAAKFRAARRLWAKILHDQYGVPHDRCAISIFSYTLGGALSARQPANNITRIAYEALAAVLGGVQTLATSSWDEAHSLPSAEAASLSLRTQQILAFETGVTRVVDPLGGSWYVEALTDRIEKDVAAEVAAILDRGGAVACIENGYVEQMLADAAYRDFRDVEEGRRTIVGVNFKPADDEPGWESDFRISADVAEEAIASLNATRGRRDRARVVAALDGLRGMAATGANVMPALIEAARARATIGEMTSALADVHGSHSAGERA